MLQAVTGEKGIVAMYVLLERNLWGLQQTATGRNGSPNDAPDAGGTFALEDIISLEPTDA